MSMFGKKTDKGSEPMMKEGKPSLAIAFAVQRKNKKKKMAEGGKVGGAETSTTGNKTKTGGSNPGGASTGGAGTVTITTGNKPPKSISVSDVGGKTDARNSGGMDPGDKDDKMKMALGGAVETATHSQKYSRNPGAQAKKPDDSRRPKDAYLSKDWAGEPELDDASDTSMRPPEDEYMGDKFAKGGPVHPRDLMDDDERASSIADAIMDKRQRMAEGGMADMEANSEESPNSYDDLNEDAANDPQYDDDQISSQPKDSNQTGDPREDSESDPHDMVSRIYAKMRAKRK